MKDKDYQKTNKSEMELNEKLSKDFVVKNMPSISRLSGANYEFKQSQKNQSINVNKLESANQISHAHSYRKTGLVIISAGIIVIIVLFYLAYRFLILPSLQVEKSELINTPQPLVVNTATDDSVMEKTDESENIIEPAQVITEEIIANPDDLKNNILEIPSVLDSDGDGLSDVAEAFLGTDPYNSDTDGDGYFDKDEIMNGYNPLGQGLLTASSKIALFVEKDRQYAIIYPQTWELNIVNDSVLFAAPGQDFIQVSHEDSDKVYASILEWYEEQFSEVDILTADRFVRSSFGTGIISADGQFVYFLDANGTRVFVLSYISADSSLSYLEIFQMMVATFMKV